jgi:alpha-L-fucosidase
MYCALASCTHTAASARAATPKPEDPVYLFTSFRGNGEDGLRFLYSFDGYQWLNVPGTFLKPRVGPSGLMRDPCVARGPDGVFHLVWTTGWKGDQGFGCASSKDLVHWSPQQFVPVMEHEPTSVNVWAPEIFYDADEQEFDIFWASTIPGRYPDGEEEHANNHRMYYTTTRNFRHFTPAKLFIEPGFSVIDGTVVKDGSRYVLVHKDNTRRQLNLRVAFSDGPRGPWRDVSQPFTPQFTEGPSVLRLGDRWLIYFDAYRANSYGAVETNDFKSFADISDKVSFPPGHKHGTAFLATRADLDRLLRIGGAQVSGVRLPLATTLPASQAKTRLAEIDAVAKRGPFDPNWDSLTKFKPPAWYHDAKFGIFIHWGAYSVPAFGSEWYPRNMYRPGSLENRHHLEKYGPLAAFGYKDFIPQFKAEKFDAAVWARLFKQAGARYVIPVAEHHDGFPMYDSALTEWSAAKKGPRRDVIGQLAQALANEGLAFGASSHRAEHWWFYDSGMYALTDVADPANAALYGPASNQRTAENQSEPPDEAFLDDWLLRSCEIVDKYQPQIMYFDWWICQPVFQPYLQRFAAYYYNRGAERGQQVAINFKEWEGRSFPDGAGVFDIERGQSAHIRPDFWQTDTSVSIKSWGYVEGDQYRDAGDLVDDLADIVSKNGALLLNVGPKSDGTIPEEAQSILRGMGQWLAVNGEAIYGTRPWKRFGEGPTPIVAGSFNEVKRTPFTAEDFRFTTKGDALYDIALAWPADGKLLVKCLGTGAPEAAGEVRSVELLGSSARLSWKQMAGGLEASLPSKPPCDYAVTLKIVGPTVH